jgi:DMSO/TMAO reductase YedYZ molybdopterin-dependent catalytic subunit
MLSTQPVPTMRRTRSELAVGALAGLASAALGLGTAELVAGFLGRTATPVVAVGEAFIDRTPTWLKDLAVEWFGTADKAVLIAGVLIVFAAISAGIGLLTVRRRRLGLLAAGGLGLIAVAATWTRADTTSIDLWAAVIGTVASLIALDVLASRAARIRSQTADPAEGRRGFLRATLTILLMAGATYLAGRWLGGRRSSVEESRESVAPPEENVTAHPGADLGVRGVEPWQTPNGVFYRIDTALSVPLLTAEDWRLRVHGLVEREITLDYDQLVGMGLVGSWVTLTCVSNEVGGYLAGNARWSGVRIADVLARAEPRPEADAVRSMSADGWTAGTPLDVLTDGRDALFAVTMNGEPLPVEHGFPVRMVVPGLYGFVSATKWVVDVEVSRFDAFDAYWSTRGWAEQAPIKTSSRIEVPRSSQYIAAGPVPVAGTAWAQHRGIQAVEVRVDGGPWQRARLGTVPSTDTWRQWVWQWDATPGEHRLQARAIDSEGEIQIEESAPPAPDGATGWHEVTVEVDA